MTQVADASVAIDADMRKFSSGLKSGLDKAETQTQGLGSTMKTALSPAALFGAVGGTFAAAGVINFLGDATQAAGVFQDTVSATGVIFSDEFTPALEAWADEAHSAFGASKQDALDAANGIAVFGKSAGLAGQDLVNFSTELVQLGGDLASMFGGSTQDAITAVGAALRGEFEPIRRYGVLLDDATLRQQAFEMGLVSTTKNALTPQVRVLAAQAAIFAQTGDAQGDFARTSDGLMNTQRDLQASFENLQIEIGEKLLPVMTALSQWALKEGIPALEKFLAVIAESGPIIEGIWDAITPGRATAEMFNEIAHQGSSSFDVIENEWRDRAEEWKGLLTRPLREVASEAGHWLTAGAGPIGDAAEIAIVDPVKAAADEAKRQAEEAARALTGDYASELTAGADTISTAWDTLNDAAENEQTKGQRIAEAKAFLTSKALTDALNSEDPYRKLAAIQARESVEAELEALTTNAQYQAWLTGTSVPEAIEDNKEIAARRARQLQQGVINALKKTEGADEGGNALGAAWMQGIIDGINDNAYVMQLAVTGIRNQLGHSLPTEGPLAGDAAEQGGRAIGESWLGGIGDTLQRGAGDLLSGFTMPSLAPVGYGSVGATDTSSVGGRTITVNVIDAGVAASVADIARGLREFEDTGMLP